MKTLKKTIFNVSLLPKITFKKSKSLATVIRDEGNNFLAEKKYRQALSSFNKSLCHAKHGSPDVSQGFADRSTVYFETSRFRECIENIELARVHGYDDGKMLNERERLCREMMDKTPPSIEDFKLSYPSHPTIPFIANCLELRENEEFGRHIIANTCLMPGDVIAIEEPFLKSINFATLELFKYQRCFNCLRSNHLNLMPSRHLVMACSQACHDSICERNLEAEEKIETQFGWPISKMIQIKNEMKKLCGHEMELEKLFNGTTRTVFDFNFSDVRSREARESLFKCTISLTAAFSASVCDENIELFKLSLGHEQNENFLGTFIEHLMAAFARNQYSMHFFDVLRNAYATLGYGLLPFASLLNHSCNPNIIWILVENKFVFIVAKPIKNGDQLFHCYSKTFLHESLQDRQRHLMKQYGFQCKCEACSENFSMKPNAVEHSLCQIERVKDIREEISRNWKMIAECHEAHMSSSSSPLETMERILENKKLLECLAWNCVL